MPAYFNHYKQIASRSSIFTRLSLSADSYTLTIINTGGNYYLDLLTTCNIAFPVAIRTFFSDDFTGTSAVRAGLNISNNTEQRLLGINHLSLTAAFFTGFRARSMFCTVPVAGGTLILKVQVQFLLRAKYGLFKANSDGSPEICSLHRSVISTSGTTASKKITKDITKDIPHIHSAKIESTATGSSLKSRMSKLVILSSLVRITKDCISFGSFLKLCFGFLVPRIGIWMILFGKFSICFF